MKAIILAAGKGTRLGEYAKNKPKGMLEFAGKTLIERQIGVFSNFGINEIIIITGYKSHKIEYENIKYYHNKYYNSTNMVESFILAQNEFDDDIIVSYSDIIFQRNVLQKLIESKHSISVAVDLSWEKYWEYRYDNIAFDLESLKLRKDGSIYEIGNPDTNLKNIDGRYIGLIKFRKDVLDKIKFIYGSNRDKFLDKPWGKSGNIFQQAYFTDLLNKIIEEGMDVSSVLINGGWLEFDTNQDYERMAKLYNNGYLKELIDLEI